LLGQLKLITVGVWRLLAGDFLLVTTRKGITLCGFYRLMDKTTKQLKQRNLLKEQAQGINFIKQPSK